MTRDEELAAIEELAGRTDQPKPRSTRDKPQRNPRVITHCPRGHEYTPENTRMYLGHRYCKACKRERNAGR